MRDSLGELIRTGDTLVYATRRGSEARLRNAVVTGGDVVTLGPNKKVNRVFGVNDNGRQVVLLDPHKRTAVVKKFRGRI